MSIDPIIIWLASGYFVVSVLGALGYAWLRYRRRERPVIRRLTDVKGPQLLLTQRGRTYASRDGYEWRTTNNKPVSRRKAAQFQGFVETYGWVDV